MGTCRRLLQICFIWTGLPPFMVNTRAAIESLSTRRWPATIYPCSSKTDISCLHFQTMVLQLLHHSPTASRAQPLTTARRPVYGAAAESACSSTQCARLLHTSSGSMHPGVTTTSAKPWQPPLPTPALRHA